MGLFVRPKFQQSPSRIKSHPVSSSSHMGDHLHTWKTYAQSRSRSSSLRYNTPYVKQGFTANLESSTSSTGTLLRLFAPCELNRFYSPLDRVWASLQANLPRSFEKIICSIKVTHLHCVGRQNVLQKAPGALVFTVLDNTSYMKHLEHGYLPQELNLYRSSLTGAYCASAATWGIEHHPHTIKFEAWLWCHS